MLKIMLTLLTLSLCACGATSNAVQTTTGAPGYSIDCETWEECRELAQKLCGAAGYDVISTNKDRHLQTSNYSTKLDNENNMVVSCRK